MVVTSATSSYDRMQAVSTRQPTARERIESAREQQQEGGVEKSARAPQPVVNTQGQTTGQLLNVKA